MTVMVQRDPTFSPTVSLSKISEIESALGESIRGKEEVLRLSLACLLARGHLLIEDVPGVGKTTLAQALARSVRSSFHRLQFTSDMLPSDVLGVTIYNAHTEEFEFKQGPIFTHFLLADEINRAPAKTQSALLQAMQERTVTIDRDTHLLPPDFTVFATQNPIEFEGTYPLPEAQKDRFLLKLPMPAPERESELALARRMLGSDAPEVCLERGDVQAVLGEGELARARDALNDVAMRDELAAYIVDLVRRTRTHESVLVGAGPRATQALVAASRGRAALDGRDYVTPDDVKSMAVPVIEHRLILRPEFEIEGLLPAEAIQKMIEGVAVPV